MSATVGLSDGQRTIVGIIIYSLIGIQGYIAIEVAAGNFPIWALPPFTIATIIASVIERQLGIKEATTAASSKATNPGLATDRHE